MGLINKSDAEYLRGAFAKGLSSPVRFMLFVSEHNCKYCKDLEAILRELCGLSDMLSVEVHDAETDKELFEQYRMDLIPALAVLKIGDGVKDYGIRYYGIPAGHEFSPLVESVLRVSTGESGLSEKAKEKLRNLRSPLHIKVFVTPTCPHCPHAVALAHRMAIESPLVRSDMIEAIEFPELADRYGVFAVPKIVVNDAYDFEGALPELAFVDSVLKAVE